MSDDNQIPFYHQKNKSLYLSPIIINLLLELHHLFQIRYIRRDNQYILLSNYFHKFFSNSVQLFLINIRYSDLQSQPVTRVSSLSLIPREAQSIRIYEWKGKGKKKTYFANSFAAAFPIPLAAPVTTATRPACKTGCNSSATDIVFTV